MPDPETTKQVMDAEECKEALIVAHRKLQAAKPNDRSDKDRYYAVTITDLEKVLAYFTTYVAYLE